MTAATKLAAWPDWKEHSMIFAPPSVRAILDGSKTRTRRIMKPQPATGAHGWQWSSAKARSMVDRSEARSLSPYGAPGDRIWVRESWRTWERPDDMVDGIRYAADDGFQRIANTTEAAERWVGAHDNDKHGDRWRPSIFMPRWASRITLEITGVAIERLQDITDAEAELEGVNAWDGSFDNAVLYHVAKKLGGMATDHRTWFAALWDHLNGSGSWDENPWCWALSFKRIEQATEETT